MLLLSVRAPRQGLSSVHLHYLGHPKRCSNIQLRLKVVKAAAATAVIAGAQKCSKRCFRPCNLVARGQKTLGVQDPAVENKHFQEWLDLRPYELDLSKQPTEKPGSTGYLALTVRTDSCLGESDGRALHCIIAGAQGREAAEACRQMLLGAPAASKRVETSQL